MKLFSSIRNFFFVKYVRLIEFITLLMIARTGNLVRKLLVLKGKDPDYVAPAPAPPPPTMNFPALDGEKAFKTINKFLNSNRPAWNTSAQDAWVKNPGLHPILAARKQYESQDKPSTVDPLPEPQPAPLTPEEASELLRTQDPSAKEWTYVVKSAASGEEK